MEIPGQLVAYALALEPRRKAALLHIVLAVLGRDFGRSGPLADRSLSEDIQAVSLELAEAGLLVQEAGVYRFADGGSVGFGQKQWDAWFEERFWPAVWPGGKKDKPNAKKAWSTIYKSLPRNEKGLEQAEGLCQRILDGAARYAITLAAPGAPSMKYPQGWLSGRRWEDEITLEELTGKPVGPQSLGDRYRAARGVSNYVVGLEAGLRPRPEILLLHPNGDEDPSHSTLPAPEATVQDQVPDEVFAGISF